MHCKYHIPITKMLGLQPGVPVNSPSLGNMGNDKFAVGCPITNDAKYKRCKACPKGLKPRIMYYDLPWYWQDDTQHWAQEYAK